MTTKARKMGAENEKTKKMIEGSVFIHFLNQKLEETHKVVFTGNYKLQLLYLQLVKQQPVFTSPRELA